MGSTAGVLTGGEIVWYVGSRNGENPIKAEGYEQTSPR
jgi:hypothetical protein